MRRERGRWGSGAPPHGERAWRGGARGSGRAGPHPRPGVRRGLPRVRRTLSPRRAAALPLRARRSCSLCVSALPALPGEPCWKTGAGCRSPRSAGQGGSDPAARRSRSASGLGVVQGVPQKVAVIATVVAQRRFFWGFFLMVTELQIKIRSQL